jgi:hypothetical protein
MLDVDQLQEDVQRELAFVEAGMDEYPHWNQLLRTLDALLTLYLDIPRADQ